MELFYYLIDLHYSQTRKMSLYELQAVLLPYRFTLFSNNNMGGVIASRFYYLIDLHYSQTVTALLTYSTLFYYLIDLHYSQTVPAVFEVVLSFTTL